MRSGGDPGIDATDPSAPDTRGTARSRPIEYGWRGREKRWSTAARSSIRPAYSGCILSARSAGLEEVLQDRDHGIERAQRGREHHRALGPTEATELLAVELEDRHALPAAVIHDLARGDARAARRKANEADGEGRFSRARLADDRERRALFEVE